MASTSEPILIFVLPGSQFTAKVLAALQQRKIDHYIAYVPFDEAKRRKFIPSGGLLVPEMQVGKLKENPTIVSDSELILHWIDENRQAGLYPFEQCSEISKRASDGKLAGLVFYYNWVQEKGFRASMLPTAKQTLPRTAQCIVPNFVFARALSSTRQKFRGKTLKAIGMDESDESILSQEDKMKQILIDELVFFQSLLQTDEQPYLIPQTTQPTAADFSVYAQLERLVGEGTASDVTVYPACQELYEEQKETLGRLWKWYQHMRKTCPVQFKGKRPPAELLSSEDD